MGKPGVPCRDEVLAIGDAAWVPVEAVLLNICGQSCTIQVLEQPTRTISLDSLAEKTAILPSRGTAPVT